MSLRPLDRDVKSLLTKLLINHRAFFSKEGVLNSEGRKLFERIARLIVREHPERKEVISKTRKNPTLRSVFQIATMFMEEDEVYELLYTDLSNNTMLSDKNYP